MSLKQFEILFLNALHKTTNFMVNEEEKSFIEKVIHSTKTKNKGSSKIFLTSFK